MSLLLLAVLLIVLFGGLGLFVAKVFLVGALAVLIISLIGGATYGRRSY